MLRVFKMKSFNAYCHYCHVNVEGKITAITALESGNWIVIGECLICCYEIKRIIPKDKFNNTISNIPVDYNI